MKPFIHAKNSANKFGGKPEDYLAIHDFMDSSKAVVPDMRHRAIFHSAFGCFIVEKVFGTTIVNSDGDEVSTRDIAEEHILEDLGRIPTLQDWLNEMQFKEWMMSPELRKDYQDPSVNPCVEIKFEGSDINEKERSQIKTIKTTEQDLSENNLRPNSPVELHNLILDGARAERFDDIPLETQIRTDAIEKNNTTRVVDGKRIPNRWVRDGRLRHRPLPNDDTNNGDNKSTFD